MKEKYNINLFFPTYLSNQKIQGMGTANKHFFKDGFIDSFSCKHADYFYSLWFRERFGSAPIYVFAGYVVSTILQSNEMSGG